MANKGTEPGKSPDQNCVEVHWTEPSKNSEESMPTGGCGVGLNVWMEEGGILVYFQQSGTFDEHNGFPKLGRIRLRPIDGPAELADFSQTLDTNTGEIEIRWKAGSHRLRAVVWASQIHPEFHIELEGSPDLRWEAHYESWRFEDRVSAAQGSSTYFGERFDIFAYPKYPHDLIRHKDQIESVKVDLAGSTSEAICFYHQNDNSDLAFDKEMDQQGFRDYKKELYNPQKDLVFGGVLFCEGAEYRGTTAGSYLETPYLAHRLMLPETAQNRVTVVCRTAKHASVDDWRKELFARAAALDEATVASDREATHRWWDAYWNRSHVGIEPRDEDAERNRRAREVSRNYRLFRFMLGTNHKGTFPTKFNGGNHTYDSGLVHDVEMERGLGITEPQNKWHFDFGPDFRAWGGGSLTQQNQRLVYWPMIKSGDTDLMDPQLDWCINALPAAELRSQIAWHGRALQGGESAVCVGGQTLRRHAKELRADAVAYRRRAGSSHHRGHGVRASLTGRACPPPVPGYPWCQNSCRVARRQVGPTPPCLKHLAGLPGSRLY